MVSRIITISMGGIIVGMIIISFLNLYQRAENVTGDVIVQDIKKLITIFEKIDTECGIVDFDHQQNIINFLNVGTFTGSEVGPMNLKFPEKWQGPYLNDNPTVQSIEYMVVRTKDGYFITPGNGVKLPNGKIIGKDIVLDENADIEAMMRDPKLLSFKGQSLAGKLQIQKQPEIVDKELWTAEV